MTPSKQVKNISLRKVGFGTFETYNRYSVYVSKEKVCDGLGATQLYLYHQLWSFYKQSETSRIIFLPVSSCRQLFLSNQSVNPCCHLLCRVMLHRSLRYQNRDSVFSVPKSDSMRLSSWSYSETLF